MLLPKSQARRFFRLFDQLCVYAHHQLGVVSDEELFTGELPRGLSEDGQRLTMEALWDNRDIIEDFVRDNPLHLSRADLDVLGSWVNAYDATFVASSGPDGRVYLLSEDHAFPVVGMTEELADKLTHLPTVVRTTLLPYQNYVVYGMFMTEMAVELGPSIVESTARELAVALADGRVIATGPQLVGKERELTERHVEREVERFRREIEMDERARGPLEGQHVGALAGIVDEGEREQAKLREQIARLADKLHDTVRQTLEELALGIPLTTSLFELLATEDLPTQADMLELIEDMTPESLGIDPDDEHARERLEQLRQEAGAYRESGDINALTNPIEHLAQRYLDAEFLQRFIERLDERTITHLKSLAEHEGMLPIRVEEIQAPAEIPYQIRGLRYLFEQNGGFIAVMPQEVVPLARQLDWDRAFACARRHARLVRFFDVIADLRGIVPFAEALEEYLRLYPEDNRDEQDVADELMDAIEDDESSACFLDTGEELYLVHYLLQFERRRELGEDATNREVADEGEPGELVQSILDLQRRHEPRPVLREMVECQDLYEWKEQQSVSLAMRDFLDRHVPDGQNEYSYSERVMELLFEEAMWGADKGSVSTLFDILECNGFVPDESQVQLILNLWMGLCNGLPIWPNNGWSPNELLGRRPGPRVFFNPDGSVMRVGRNDPCPCGSGKKYKRCCGR